VKIGTIKTISYTDLGRPKRRDGIYLAVRFEKAARALRDPRSRSIRSRRSSWGDALEGVKEGFRERSRERHRFHAEQRPQQRELPVRSAILILQEHPHRSHPDHSDALLQETQVIETPHRLKERVPFPSPRKITASTSGSPSCSSFPRSSPLDPSPRRTFSISGSRRPGSGSSRSAKPSSS